MLTRTLCASALLACAGAAIAQSQHEEHRHEVVVEKAHPTHTGSGVFHWTSADDDANTYAVSNSEDVTLIYSPAPRGEGMRATYLNGGTTIKLVIDGDRVSDLQVKINGDGVGNARAKVEDGQVIVTNARGDTIAQFSAPKFDGEKHEITWNAQPQGQNAVARVRGERDAAREMRVAATGRGSSEAPNRRVIGIFASSPGEALAAQLGLEPDQVIVVDQVNEGMPAERAGLKRYDIITGIEGTPPATLDRLREVITSKSDNEPIRLTILRGGQKQQVELVPTPEAGSAIEIEIDDADNDATPFGQFFKYQNNQNLSAEQRARAEEAMARAHEIMQAQRERLADLQSDLHERMLEMNEQLHERLSDDGTMDEIRQAYQQAIRELSNVDVQRQLEQALAQVREAIESSAAAGQQQIRQLPRIEFLERDSNGRGVIVAPVAPAAPGAPAAPAAPRFPGQARSAGDDARMQALEERMARIEQLLERIAEDRDR